MNVSSFFPHFEIGRQFRRLAVIVPFLGFSTFAHAAFTLYQNFESLPDGYDIADDSNPDENFSVALQEISSPGARYGTYTVIADPTNPGNRLLSLDAVGYAFSGQIVDAATGTPNPIVNLNTGTLFYRVYRSSVVDTPDINFGGADQGPVMDDINNAGQYQSQLNVSGGTSIFRPRNGGGTVDTGVNWTSGTWFGIYQVINTATNTSQFYYQGESDPEPILLTGIGGSPSDMAFRNGGARPSTNIEYFLAVNGLPGSGVNDVFYLDDIYLDATGINLTAPVAIPEPGTCALLLTVLLGGSVVLIRRKEIPGS